MHFLTISILLYSNLFIQISTSEKTSQSFYAKMIDNDKNIWVCFREDQANITDGVNNQSPERLVVYLYKNPVTQEIKAFVPSPEKQALIPNFPASPGNTLKPTELIASLFNNQPGASAVSNKGDPIGLNQGKIKTINIKPANTESFLNQLPPQNQNAPLLELPSWTHNDKPQYYPEQQVPQNLYPQLYLQDGYPTYTFNLGSEQIQGINSYADVEYTTKSHANIKNKLGNKTREKYTLQSTSKPETIPLTTAPRPIQAGPPSVKPELFSPGSANKHLTFEQWFTKQMNTFQSANLPDDVKAIDSNLLRSLVQKTLFENHMNIGSTGLITDVDGIPINVQNLELRPILIGNSFNYQALKGIQQISLPQPLPYLDGILVTLVFPPKILGIIPLGKTYVSKPSPVISQVKATKVDTPALIKRYYTNFGSAPSKPLNPTPINYWSFASPVTSSSKRYQKGSKFGVTGSLSSSVNLPYIPNLYGSVPSSLSKKSLRPQLAGAWLRRSNGPEESVKLKNKSEKLVEEAKTIVKEATKIENEAKKLEKKTKERAKKLDREAEKLEKEAKEGAKKLDRKAEKLEKEAKEEAKKLDRKAETLDKAAEEGVKKLDREAEKLEKEAKEGAKKLDREVEKLEKEDKKGAKKLEHEAEKLEKEAKHLKKEVKKLKKHAEKSKENKDCSTSCSEPKDDPPSETKWPVGPVLESRPHMPSGPKPLAKSKQLARPKPPSGPEPESGPHPSSGTKPPAVPKPPSDPIMKSEPHAPLDPKLTSGPHAPPRPKPEGPHPPSAPKPELGPRPSSGAKPPSEPKIPPGPKPESGPYSPIVPNPASDPQPPSDHKPESRPHPPSGTKPESGHHPHSGSELKSGPRPFPGPKPDSKPKPHSKSETKAERSFRRLGSQDVLPYNLDWDRNSISSQGLLPASKLKDIWQKSSSDSNTAAEPKSDSNSAKDKFNDASVYRRVVNAITRNKFDSNAYEYLTATPYYGEWNFSPKPNNNHLQLVVAPIDSKWNPQDPGSSQLSIRPLDDNQNDAKYPYTQDSSSPHLIANPFNSKWNSDSKNNNKLSKWGDHKNDGSSSKQDSSSPHLIATPFYSKWHSESQINNKSPKWSDHQNDGSSSTQDSNFPHLIATPFYSKWISESEINKKFPKWGDHQNDGSTSPQDSSSPHLIATPFYSKWNSESGNNKKSPKWGDHENDGNTFKQDSSSPHLIATPFYSKWNAHSKINNKSPKRDDNRNDGQFIYYPTQYTDAPNINSNSQWATYIAAHKNTPNLYNTIPENNSYFPKSNNPDVTIRSGLGSSYWHPSVTRRPNTNEPKSPVNNARRTYDQISAEIGSEESIEVFQDGNSENLHHEVEETPSRRFDFPVQSVFKSILNMVLKNLIKEISGGGGKRRKADEPIDINATATNPIQIEGAEDDHRDFRIIGGSAATGSGSPLSNKGRSGLNFSLK